MEKQEETRQLKDMTYEEQVAHLLSHDKEESEIRFDEIDDPEMKEYAKACDNLEEMQNIREKNERIFGGTFHHSKEIQHERGKKKYSKKAVRESEQETNELIDIVRQQYIHDEMVSRVDSDFSDFCWDLLDDFTVVTLKKSLDFTEDEQWLIECIYTIKSNETGLYRKQICFRGLKDLFYKYERMKGWKFGYGDATFEMSLNKSLYDIGKSILDDEELRKELDWSYIDVKSKRKNAGKKKAQTIEITCECDQKILAKYKLQPGQQFDSCGDLAEYCGFSTSQRISKWKKLGYVIKKL